MGDEMNDDGSAASTSADGSVEHAIGDEADLTATTSRGPRRGLMLAGLVVLVFGAGSALVWGLTQSTATPAEAVANAVVRSLHAKTATMDLHVTIAAAGETMEMAGTGALNCASGASFLDSTVWPPAGAGDTAQLTQITTGSTTYLRYSVPSKELVIGGAGADVFGLPPGKVWLSMDLGTLGALKPSPTVSSGADTLVGTLHALTASGGRVKVLGGGRIDRQQVVRYAVTTTRAQALAQLRRSSASAEIKQKVSEALPVTPTTTIVAVGRSGVLVQLSTTTHATGAGSTGSVVTTITFAGWGQPVTIDGPPPAYLVEPLAALRSGTTSA